MATIFIGDVHGCAEELEELLQTLQIGADDKIYLAGDLFDRGPDPRGVLDLVLERGLLSVQSNHEVHLALVLRRYLKRKTWPATYLYVIQCLNELLDRAEEFLAYVDALPFHRIGPPSEPSWVLVHAGVHPQECLAGTSHEMAINMRRFPYKDPEAPFWHESYTGDPLIIFGHSARSLPLMIRRQGRLVVAGLDTGCVYGGRLTALRLEDEQLVSVAAKRNYRR